MTDGPDGNDDALAALLLQAVWHRDAVLAALGCAARDAASAAATARALRAALDAGLAAQGLDLARAAGGGVRGATPDAASLLRGIDRLAALDRTARLAESRHRDAAAALDRHRAASGAAQARVDALERHRAESADARGAAAARHAAADADRQWIASRHVPSRGDLA